jgi:transcription initiation factor TFIID TATA-box-binding protein
MVDLKIENVIASTEFEFELDLPKIAEEIDDAEFDPEHFPGIIYKLKSPKTVTLMFSKGYTVCTGAKSIQNAKAALTIIIKKLNDKNLIELLKLPKINVQNVIVSYNYKTPLNLDEIAKKMPKDSIEYNPRKFPGVVFHDKTTDITVLIFRSGVIVGEGSPHVVDLDDVLTKLEQYYT